MIDDDLSAQYIYMFKPSTRSWVETEHLPSNRWRCACALLPGDKILIAGGAAFVGIGVKGEVLLLQHYNNLSTLIMLNCYYPGCESKSDIDRVLWYSIYTKQLAVYMTYM